MLSRGQPTCCQRLAERAHAARAQGEEGTRYAHLECAIKWCRDNSKPLVPPTCKHWRMRGYCSFGTRCFYSHPESCLQELARAAAARWGCPPPGSGGAARLKARRAAPHRCWELQAGLPC
jgi:hypothetical protein